MVAANSTEPPVRSTPRLPITTRASTTAARVSRLRSVDCTISAAKPRPSTARTAAARPKPLDSTTPDADENAQAAISANRLDTAPCCSPAWTSENQSR